VSCSDWKNVKLGEVADVSWGDTSTTKAAYAPEGYLAYSATGPDGYLPWAAFDETGIVVSAIGAQAGKTWLAKGKWSCIKNTIRVLVTQPGVSADYLYWATREPSVWPLRGSAQPFISQGDARGISLSLPPYAEQRAIAEVLGALDDKIAANTQLSRIADDYVRARYEEVERSSKESIAVSKLATARRDTVNPGSSISGTLYIGLEHIPRRLMWLGDSGYATDVTSQKSSFEQDDILFGKLRPYFHKVVAVPHAGVSSTDILVLTPTVADLSGFVLAALASDSVVASVTAMSEGTRMPRTSWKDLSAVEVPWPGQARAKEFSSEIMVLRSAVEGLLAENQTLAATRDALLPQLMSGKLRVRDAEKAVEAVG